ncbi:RecF/RecN/SMC protein [Lipomyces japonicus]|uniref:RecF/RecN/SMC protein n=1 Tax=Lipomyces japonicus TaxID=56871 RepID=UPI0034CD3C3A
MGRLKRIEVTNFKSYKAVQTIDFSDAFFTSIIGPNGAGKSNMMDAISFVLGIKSSHLRSNQVKDLVYRGRIMSAADNVDSDAALSIKDPNTASVSALYVKDDGTELELKRIITGQGSSEYRLNGKPVTARDYSRALEEENILVKARNFLVFQGDVEAIAAQSPKDLTRLIEQISGSLEYKAQYDSLKLDQDKADEASNTAFNKKRSFNAEIRQYQAQQEELKNFKKKQKEKEAAIILHILWKLYHYEETLDYSNVQLDATRESIRRLQTEYAEAQKLVDRSKSEHAKVLRQFQKSDKKGKKVERLLEEKRTNLVPIDEKIKVVTRAKGQHQARAKEVRVDHVRQEKSAQKLQTDLTNIDKAIAEFEQDHLSKQNASGISLSPADLQEYTSLRESVNKEVATNKNRLDNLVRQQNADKDTLATLESKVADFQQQHARLEAEISDHSAHQDQASVKVNNTNQELEAKKQSLNRIISERLQQAAKETELNEKLGKCVSKLVDINADKRESERQLRQKETIATLKRLIPGVRGKVSDLCKPKQKKYETAMITVLGRDFDAVVVDTQKTAADCITYLREQRAGILTLIPLDSVVVKPISTSLRGMHKQMRLAIDTIDFDASNERAMQYVCGSSIVCDDLEVAKYLRWEKGIESKAVTLDGSVIHKGGLMTGGQSNSTFSKKWDDENVKGLERLKDNLLAELAELAKLKHHPSTEEALGEDVAGLEQKLNHERDQLASVQRILNSKQSELEVVEDQLGLLRPRVESAKANVSRAQTQIHKLRDSVEAVEDEVFEEFCQQIGVENIRQYEEFQGVYMQQVAQKRLEFITQRLRIQNQLTFEEERLRETFERLTKLENSIERSEQLINQLEAEQNALKEEVESLETELKSITEEGKEFKKLAESKADELSKLKAAANAIAKKVESQSKTLMTLQEELEKTSSLRTGILRTCKLEGTNIPLVEGSLEDIPIGEEALTENMMDIDEESAPSQVRQIVQKYGIVVDFETLPDNLKEDGSEELQQTFEEDIRTLTSEVEKMNPNMKAIERLNEAEDRLDGTEREFSKARKNAKSAKDMFNDVKEKRLELFNDAFSHITDQIDKIYKELTKSRSFPLGGTAYLTVEDQDEPYLNGIKYHAMPPMKRFRDMEQLSGGEKTIAALALLFAIHSYRPSPFFVLDEVDAALDNANVAKIANYIHDHAGPGFQFIVISLKNALFERSDSLVGIYRAQAENSSRVLTLDLKQFGAN